MASKDPARRLVCDYYAAGPRQLVATTMAVHNPTELHPFGGEMGWVAADPAHAGGAAGLAVCAAVTARLVRRPATRPSI